MTPSVLEGDPAAADVQLDTQTLTMTLQDERQIIFVDRPFTNAYP
jgi:hypothetical protein